MRRLLVLTTAAAVLLFAAGCDGGGGDGDDDTDDGETTTSSEEATTSSAEEQAITVEYPAGGPVDNVFPPGDPAYKFLSEGDCGSLLSAADSWVGDESIVDTEGADTIPLYQAAGRACQGDFAGAAELLGQMGSPPQFNRNQCSRGVVLAWVTDLVQASQEDPGFAPELVVSGEGNPCPEDETATTEGTTEDTTGGTTGDTTEDTGSGEDGT